MCIRTVWFVLLFRGSRSNPYSKRNMPKNSSQILQNAKQLKSLFLPQRAVQMKDRSRLSNMYQNTCIQMRSIAPFIKYLVFYLSMCDKDPQVRYPSWYPPRLLQFLYTENTLDKKQYYKLITPRLLVFARWNGNYEKIYCT